jgi:hypothetical protein
VKPKVKVPRFAAGSPEAPAPAPSSRLTVIDVPLLDLTSISRPGARTSIDVYGYERRPWIKLHDVSLVQHDNGSRRGTWTLDAYWGGRATDREHDSAHILRLALSGVTLDMVHYGRVSILAWIAGEEDDFHVPPQGYGELLKNHPDTEICKECRKRDNTAPLHMMVPPGFYVPPRQPELYAQMVGRRIEITIDHNNANGED